MHILVNTDHNIQGRSALTDHVRGVVTEAVSHFSDHITRVEVHLGDESGVRTGRVDRRCMIEARLERRHPIAVTYHAATLDSAVEGAAARLKRTLEHDRERRREHR